MEKLYTITGRQLQMLMQASDHAFQSFTLTSTVYGEIFGKDAQHQTFTGGLKLVEQSQLPHQYIDSAANPIPCVNIYAKSDKHINNLIGQQYAKNFFKSKEEEEELMQIELLKKIALMDNCRIRKDGRCEWRKRTSGVNHIVVERNPKLFLKKLSEYKRNLKKVGNEIKIIKPKDSHVLIDLIRSHYNRNIKGQIKTDDSYDGIINKYLSHLNRNINEYTEEDIYSLINNIISKKQARLCFYLLRYVYKSARKKGFIKENYFDDMKAPIHKSEKGTWFNPDEQSIIYQNRHISKIGDEIEFFIMVGPRLGEAFTCTPDFKNNRVWVERRKRDGTSGWVEISNEYNKFLQERWQNMFKSSDRFYSEEFGKLLNTLKIKRQKNERPIHRLRHTFATNIYYLGAKDSKKRSYLLGHKSTQITDDIYTDFDPCIKKTDVTSIYGNLYPIF